MSLHFFDRVYASATHYYGSHVRPEFAEFAGVFEGLQVLDLGCGQGRHAIFSAKRGATVHAVDQSAEAIGQLEAYRRAHQLTIRCEVADINRLAISSNCYDRAILVTCLDHLDRLSCSSIEQKLWTTIRQSGQVYIEVFTTKDSGYSGSPDRSETSPPVRHYFEPFELKTLFRRWNILTYREFEEIDSSHGPTHVHGIALLIAQRTHAHDSC